MPESKFSTIYIPRQTRVILDQVQAKYHPDLPLGQIVHRAMAIYNRKAEYRDEATTLSTKEPVMDRPGSRKVKTPRDTKKVKSDPAPVQKAQASPPASQSKGTQRIPPARPQVTGQTQAPGTRRIPVRPQATVQDKEPEAAVDIQVDDDGSTLLYGSVD